MSGSIAVLSSAIDSLLDMFVSLFNYFAIYSSEKKADSTFNYGR
jgi:divalent metal cation (Fe/Co/Zn/Cd) transporter